jgi:hypothetical protein
VVLANVARDLKGAANGGHRHVGMNGKPNHTDAGRAQFSGSPGFLNEAPHVRLEARTVERFRDLGHLPLAATVANLASH